MEHLNKLRESLDLHIKRDIDYPVPTPYEDVLDNGNNIQDYILAKRILEHPEINKVLKNMDAFSKLNKFDINTYKELANQVADAIKTYDEENKDTEFTSEIKLFESVEKINGELNEFQELFLLEFIGNDVMGTASRMMGNNSPEIGMGNTTRMGGMDNTDFTTSGTENKFKDVPVKANSWLDKLMQKLGVDSSELALLTVIHHFMNKNKENKARKNSYGMSDLQTMPDTSYGVKEPEMAMEGETSNFYVQLINMDTGDIEKKFGPYKSYRKAEKLENGLLNRIDLDIYTVKIVNEQGNEVFHESIKLLSEKAPPRMEDWINKMKPKFQKEYGDRWEDVLYGKAWKIYKSGGLKESEENKNRDFSKISTERLKKMLKDHESDVGTEAVEEESKRMHIIREINKELKKRENELKESDDGFMKVKSERPKRTVDKVTKKVKDDVKKRIKELDDLIAKYNEKKHFYGDVKPEIFDAKEVLNVIMDKLKSNTEEAFKDAQLHLQKVESRILHLFPPSLIKFLAYREDGSDSVGKEINVKTS